MAYSYTEGVFVINSSKEKNQDDNLIGEYEIKYAAYSLDYPSMGVYISEPFYVTVLPNSDQNKINE